MEENKEKTYWAIINGKPVKVTSEEWLAWKIREDNTNIDLD